MALLKCACGYDQVSPSAKVCPNCKNKMTDATTMINCPESGCTEEFPKNTKICPNCGCNVKQMLQQSNTGGKRNKMKLNKAGSKKNKKGKGLKKFITKWGSRIIIAGIIITIARPTVVSLINRYNYGVESSESYVQEETMNTGYALSIFQNSDSGNSYAIHGNVDLGHFYLMEENNTLELVKTSPYDSKMHHAFDHNIVDGVHPGSPGITPLYRSAMMEEIVASGEVSTSSEFDGDKERNYHISIEKDVLDNLLRDRNNANLLNNYTASDGSTFTKLDQYLEAEMEAKNVRRR